MSAEAGGHRIQRVPPTERHGRVHSSSVVVAVIDPNQSQEFTLQDRDLKVEWYSGSGAGGQHRNKHQNSCRLTHVPTGQVATAQCRSRHNSLQEARGTLVKRLREGAASAEQARASADRLRQMGSGERGDKVRTYRFQDGLVKDHRTMRQASLARVMEGQIQLLW